MEPLSDAFLGDLKALAACHSTPGDEEEVARYLTRSWRRSGWEPVSHGRYAISARLPGDASREGPVLLVSAHMDSPGFVIESALQDRWRVIPLGTPAVKGLSAEVVVKLPEDRVWTVLTRQRAEEEGDEADGEDARYWIPRHPLARPGDRLCFHGVVDLDSGGRIWGPFLDDRLGCALLCELARRWGASPPPLRVALGATGCEEMGGFGAAVLAASVRPDLAVCLDATYASDRLGVVVGSGPVLTLTDASVLLSPSIRDRVLALAGELGLPLQTEVYNVSGTDARAFPAAGLSTCVYALLLPTQGNHSPREEGHMRDAEVLLRLLVEVCADGAWQRFFLRDLPTE
ncbi:MAG: M20/M25/M40 family metallo-hydrolase [Lentisphaeria bacterium]|nr:M20/M25/M40 family metallo-hydrolase [Lentisphaeria bacterium]